MTWSNGIRGLRCRSWNALSNRFFPHLEWGPLMKCQVRLTRTGKVRSEPVRHLLAALAVCYLSCRIPTRLDYGGGWFPVLHTLIMPRLDIFCKAMRCPIIKAGLP